jgi:transposase
MEEAEMKSKKRPQAVRHKRTNTERRPSATPLLQRIQPDAAGIDCGAEYHYVAVAPDRDPQPVHAFRTFTTDLYRLADWLVQCGVKTVAMESTGVYWIPVYEILEARGLEVVLVNARHLRNVRGRKSDVSDCEWLRDLHSVGLLSPSFRPADEIVALRSYTRQRESLAGGRYSYPAHARGANRDESSAARRAQ